MFSTLSPPILAIHVISHATCITCWECYTNWSISRAAAEHCLPLFAQKDGCQAALTLISMRRRDHVSKWTSTINCHPLLPSLARVLESPCVGPRIFLRSKFSAFCHLESWVMFDQVFPPPDISETAWSRPSRPPNTALALHSPHGKHLQNRRFQARRFHARFWEKKLVWERPLESWVMSGLIGLIRMLPRLTSSLKQHGLVHQDRLDGEAASCVGPQANREWNYTLAFKTAKLWTCLCDDNLKWGCTQLGT